MNSDLISRAAQQEDVYVFYELATRFFQSYCYIPDELLTLDGNITTIGIKECVCLLLQEGVFDSKKELRNIAFRECGFILPELAFDRWQMRQEVKR